MKRSRLFVLLLSVLTLLFGIIGPCSVRRADGAINVGQVRSFTITKNSKNSILVEISPVKKADGYAIYGKTGKGKYRLLTTSTSHQARIEGVSPKKKIKVKVRAYVVSKKNIKWGKFSTPKSINMKTPMIPQELLVTENQGGKVSIEWQTVNDSKGYKIYRKQGNGKLKLIGTVKKKKSTQFVDETTESDKEYYYAVSAFNGKYKSSKTDLVGIKTSPDPVLKMLDASSIGLPENTKTDVVFSINIENGIRVKDGDAKLYSGGEYVGDLSFNVQSLSSDPTNKEFSLSVSLSGSGGEERDFYVRCGSQTSNHVTLRFFDEVTDEEIELFKESAKAISAIDENNLNPESGYEIVEENIEKVYSLAKEWEKNNTICYLEKTESSVTMQFSSGLWYSYIPEIDGVNSGGEDVKLRIVSIQPYFNCGDENGYMDSYLADELAEYVVKNVGGLFAGNYDNTEVTCEVLSNLTKNELIIWEGHGSYSLKLGPILVLGERVKLTREQKEYLDVSGKYCLWGVSDDTYKIGVTGKFFSDLDLDLTNSCVLTTSCHLAQMRSDSTIDDRLIGPIINAGASIVAYSDSVYSLYSRSILWSVIHSLSSVNQETKKYYTLREALDIALNDVGHNDHKFYCTFDGYYRFEKVSYDHVWCDWSDEEKTFAFPVLGGSPDYRLSNENYATLDIDVQELDLNCGENARIKAETNLLNGHICWMVHDNEVVSLSEKEGESIIVTANTPGETFLACLLYDNRQDNSIDYNSKRKQAVIPIKVNETLKLEYDEIIMCLGEETMIQAECDFDSLIWGSDDATVVKVKPAGTSCILNAQKTGETLILCRKGWEVVSCKVIVSSKFNNLKDGRYTTSYSGEKGKDYSGGIFGKGPVFYKANIEPTLNRFIITIVGGMGRVKNKKPSEGTIISIGEWDDEKIKKENYHEVYKYGIYQAFLDEDCDIMYYDVGIERDYSSFEEGMKVFNEQFSTPDQNSPLPKGFEFVIKDGIITQIILKH